MGEVIGCGRGSEVEVVVVRDDVSRRNVPGIAALRAVDPVGTTPPGRALGELLIAHGPSLRVALTRRRWVDLVIPDFLRGAGSLEKHHAHSDLPSRLQTPPPPPHPPLR